jgi:hypothetical protein
MVNNISVSCLFGHYPSSNLIKSQRFRDWLCLSPQVIRKGEGRGSSYLVGPLDRANLQHWTKLKLKTRLYKSMTS